MATTAVVKKVLHKRALLHLKDKAPICFIRRRTSYFGTFISTKKYAYVYAHATERVASSADKREQKNTIFMNFHQRIGTASTSWPTVKNRLRSLSHQKTFVFCSTTKHHINLKQASSQTIFLFFTSTYIWNQDPCANPSCDASKLAWGNSCDPYVRKNGTHHIPFWWFEHFILYIPKCKYFMY